MIKINNVFVGRIKKNRILHAYINMEQYSKFNIITEEIENKFVVVFIDKKNYKEIFKLPFVVYPNYDKRGLIDDAIDVYKRIR